MDDSDEFDDFAPTIQTIRISESRISTNSNERRRQPRPLISHGHRTPHGHRSSNLSHGSSVSKSSSISSRSARTRSSNVSRSGFENYSSGNTGSRNTGSGGMNDFDENNLLLDENQGGSSNLSNQNSSMYHNYSKFGSDANSRATAFQESKVQAAVRHGNERLAKAADSTEIYKKYYDVRRGAGGVATGELKIPDNVGYDNSGRHLPIMESAQEIISSFDRQQVTLISGETGSGKSTIVPQLIMDHMVRNNQGGCIWVTQPRRIAAITIAERVADSRAPLWKHCGQGLVGYHVGLDKNCSQDARIIYMTPGIVSNKMQSDRELRSVRCLIIDEVHERDVETEMLLLLAKHLISVNKDIRLFLMSATMTPEKFKNYLTVRQIIPAVISARGRPYAVTNEYVADIQRRFPNKSGHEVRFKAQLEQTEIGPAQRTLCMDILRGLNDFEYQTRAEAPGAVLIFLPGLYEINQMRRLILNCSMQRNGQEELDVVVERLHSSLPRDRNTMKKIIDPLRPLPGRWRRKIVLSTNMGESSITISDCAYVIDFCLTKYTTKHDTAKLTRLEQRWASQEMCEQRSGRAGRTREGMCWRIIDKSFWELGIPKTQTEEILRVPLDNCVLLGKSVFPSVKPVDFLKEALARPDDKEVLEAVKSLKEIGALTMTAYERPDVDEKGNPLPMVITSEDLEDGILTPYGKLMNLLPMDRNCVKLIQLGYMVGLTYECIIIAACSSVEAFWNYNKDVSEDDRDQAEHINAYKSRLYWASGTYSDHIAMMNAFLSWFQKMPENYRRDYRKKEHKFPKFITNPHHPSGIIVDQRKELEWTQRMGINAKAVREVHMLCEDIIKRLLSAGYHLGDGNTFLDRLSTTRKKARSHPDSYICLLKTIIAGSTYPFWFNLADVQESEATKDSNAFNGTTTVYFKGAPPHENYKVGKSILHRFRHCGPISRIYFDDTRIFVEFSPELDTPSIFPSKNSLNKYVEHKGSNEFNNVTPAVICAMKMGRRRGDTSSFLNVNMNEDLQPAVQTNQDSFQGSRFFWLDVLKFGNKRATPSIKEHNRSYFATISYVESFTEFYAVEQSFEKTRDTLETAIRKLDERGKLIPFTFPVERLAMVLAPFGDGEYRTYHRAVVLATDIDEGNGIQKVLVQFVDYGNFHLLSNNDLRMLDEKIHYKDRNTGQQLNIAHQVWLAIKYKIRGLQPIKDLPERYASGLVEGAHCEIDIYSTVRGEYVLADVKVMGENLREKLIKEGVCQPKEENAADIINALNWRNAAAAKKSAKTPRQEEGQTRTSDSGLPRSPGGTVPSESNSSPEATQGKTWIEVKDVSDPNQGERGYPKRDKKLQGPYNMYSTRIQPLFQTTCSSDVQANSINSVIINPHPESNDRTLICGQDVSLVSGENMQASFTTMMPNINGIIELCGLLFAPSYQVRHVKDETERIRRKRAEEGFSDLSNIGALFGCGGYKVKGAKGRDEFLPILKDHDVDRKFTVEIDNHDLDLISDIREQFNQFLGSDNQFGVSHRNPTQVVSAQKEISRMIIDLLYRPRQKLESNQQYITNLEWKKSSDSAHFVPIFKRDTAYAVPRIPE